MRSVILSSEESIYIGVMTGFRNFNNCTVERVLLEAGYLRLREVILKRITVIEFGVNDGGGKEVL